MGGSDTICYEFFISIITQNTKTGYMYTKHSNYVFLYCLRTYLSPLFSGNEYSMNLLRLRRGTHRHWILSSDGKRERLGLYSIQRCDYSQNEQTLDLLYPHVLGTIPIGLLGLTSLRSII